MPKLVIRLNGHTDPRTDPNNRKSFAYKISFLILLANPPRRYFLYNWPF